MTDYRIIAIPETTADARHPGRLLRPPDRASRGRFAVRLIGARPRVATRGGSSPLAAPVQSPVPEAPTTGLELIDRLPG